MAKALKELIVYVKNTKRLRSGRKTNELAQYEYIGVQKSSDLKRRKHRF